MHTSVLLNESVEGLGLKKGDVVVDGTAGAGGHSAEICKREKSVKIIAFDLDGQALKHAEKMIAKAGCKPLMINANFKNMASELEKEGITEVDKIILDFGISSDQLDESGRGFTFLKDEPLLMTMKKDLKEEDLTAKEIVNNWSEENLATIIYGYGEEKYSRKIAKAIVEARKQKEIETTWQLVEILNNTVGKSYKSQKIHPATRTFQALRIAVNDELETIRKGLVEGIGILKKGGKMSVISFHSLEDRIVKNIFNEYAKNGEIKKITKKPIVAGEKERIENPRARSAKLRVIEKII
jgi:16S rRNA (cytosine1402-N4)-methyltransferase